VTVLFDIITNHYSINKLLSTLISYQKKNRIFS